MCIRDRGIIEVGVEAALGEELIVAALLHNVAVPHDENQIRVLNGGEAVGDDEAGAAFHQIGHGLLDEVLGAGIHGGGGLVQNQNLVVGQNGPGDGEPVSYTHLDVYKRQAYRVCRPTPRSLARVGASR